MHLETIAATVVAPGAGPTAAAAVSGDSLTTRAAVLGTQMFITAIVADQQAAGMVQLTYPSGHDTTRGLRVRGTANVPTTRVFRGLTMPVNPQELLSLSVSGSAVALDVENVALTLWYENVPGLSARLITDVELAERMEKIMSIDATITPTAGGTWSAPEALNAESDLMLPNRDYAIMGATFGAQCCMLGIRGPDTANVRVGIPGAEALPGETREWFVSMSRLTGLPTIPVINSGNKSGTLMDVLSDENLTAVPFTLYLALLRA